MSTPVQWEYHVEKFSNWRGVKPEEMESVLNAMGSDGWEVVSTISLPDGTIWATAKRVLTSEAARARKTSMNQI